jgi:plasmid stabilization system protein ParE
MKPIRLAAPAEADLDGIWIYTARDIAKEFPA